MKLVPEAWTILKHAWSVRFVALAIAVVWLEGPLSTLISYYAGETMFAQVFAQAVTSSLMLAAIFARVVLQNRMQERVTTAKVRRQVRARYGDQ